MQEAVPHALVTVVVLTEGSLERCPIALRLEGGEAEVPQQLQE
jgi:hypothetical protein